MALTLFASTLASCGSNETVNITVFAAASMTETMNKVKANYEAANSNVRILTNYLGSGKLSEQIQSGADCDLFISADQKTMNGIDKEGGTQTEKDYVDHSTRVNFLENKVALAVSSENQLQIKSFDDIKTHLEAATAGFKLCIGAAGVPVRNYTNEIFKNYFKFSDEQIDEFKKKDLITEGSDVKGVTKNVSEGTVSAGIIYQTDAFSANLTVVDKATSEMCSQVIYPAAIMKNAVVKAESETKWSVKQTEAKKLLEYLRGDEATKIFEAVGFSKAA